MLADDHVMFRKGVKRIIEETPDLEVVGEANDGLELLGLLKAREPKLVLLDISMPHLRGLEAIREIKKLYPQVKIIFLTMHRSKEFLHQALKAGAEGYLLKEDADSDLLRAIQTVRGREIHLIPPVHRDGGSGPGDQEADPHHLTLREKTIVKLLTEGKTPKEIAELLYLSVSPRCAGTGTTLCGNST